MLVLAPQIKNLTTVSPQPNLPSIPLESDRFNSVKTNVFLQGIFEGFIDGILLLSEQCHCIYANQCAKAICSQLNQKEFQPTSIPQEIWRVCQSLIEGREVCPEVNMILDSEITKEKGVNVRIRVRWFKFEQILNPCLLVTLEDRHQSLQQSVRNDSYKYGFTPREAEVWLLYQANYSYKEIADQLYITINTVKKHMKNIHAKRKAFGDEEI